MSEKLSIVIPAYNEEKNIAKCINELQITLREKYEIPYEIVVVDAPSPSAGIFLGLLPVFGTGDGQYPFGHHPVEGHLARGPAAVLLPGRCFLRLRGAGRPRQLPVHTRHPPRHVPRAAVVDPPVCGLRHRGGDEQPVPFPDRPGAGGVGGRGHRHHDLEKNLSAAARITSRRL